MVEDCRARILIAEDNDAARAIVARRLSHTGYEVMEAKDGVEAFHLAEQALPDVLITDWMMPQLDGVELCRRLKRDKQLRRIYILMLTAKDSSEDKVLGLDEGADDFLVKPCNPDELMARVRVGVRIGRLQRELEARQHERALVEMALALGNDINNPLTTLVGYLDMLLEGGAAVDSVQTREWLAQCRHDAMRIADIVAKLHKMRHPKLTACVGNLQMLDLAASE